MASSSTDVGLGLPPIDAKCQAATDAPAAADVTAAQQLDQMAASYLQEPQRNDAMIAQDGIIDDGSNGVDPTAGGVHHQHDPSQPSVVPSFQYQFASQHLTLQPPPPPTSSAAGADVGLDFAVQQHQQLQQQQQTQQAVSSSAAAAAASQLVAAAAASSSTYPPPPTLYYSANGGATADDLSMTSQAMTNATGGGAGLTTTTTTGQLVTYNGSTFLIHPAPNGGPTPLITALDAGVGNKVLTDAATQQFAAAAAVAAAANTMGEASADNATVNNNSSNEVQEPLTEDQKFKNPSLSYATRVSPATINWLIENYETAEGVSLPRSTLYTHYQKHW